MSLQSVKEYLKQFSLENNVLEFSDSTATVEDAAKAIGTSPAQIAKTMSFKVNGSPILIVIAGDKKVDNPKYKAEFKTKATMLSRDEAVELIGHPVGGVCPFAVNNGVTVYLDSSLKRFDYIYPACGTPNSAIKLTIEQLETASKYSKWVDISKS